MGIKKALLAGIAAALMLLIAACQDNPADAPTATLAAPTTVAPTPAPAIRSQGWAVLAEGGPLHEAVIAGNWWDVEEFLDKGADVNATATVQIHVPSGLSVSGLTPLHLASALNGDPEVAALLLDRGADIKDKDDYGSTPLYWAARSNANPEVAALLLDRGADIEAGSEEGRTPLHSAALLNDNPEVAALLLIGAPT